MAGQVDALYIHPIKSCRGVSVDLAALDRRGMVHDRRWMVVDGTGAFRTLRTLPRFALVHVALDRPNPLDAVAMQLTAPGAPPLELPLGLDEGPMASVTVWGDPVAAKEHEEGSRWFSEVLEDSVRLVYMPEDARRPVGRAARELDSPAGDILSFADSYPLLLLGSASVTDLSSRIGHRMSPRRFRPNVLLGGLNPYAEDDLREVTIGEVTFDVVSPCTRCSATTVDPETGVTGKEPLKTLARFRRRGSDVVLGMNARHRTPGTLRVGDRVEALAKG